MEVQFELGQWIEREAFHLSQVFVDEEEFWLGAVVYDILRWESIAGPLGAAL